MIYMHSIYTYSPFNSVDSLSCLWPNAQRGAKSHIII